MCKWNEIFVIRIEFLIFDVCCCDKGEGKGWVSVFFSVCVIVIYLVRDVVYLCLEEYIVILNIVVIFLLIG